MSTFATPQPGVKTHEQARLDRASQQGTAKSILECLIVSTDADRREVLSQAAAEQGWSAVVCGDAETARNVSSRIAVKMAIVDLERPQPAAASSFRELSGELAEAGGPLLVLCGADGDIAQEIWARQLGAWLYLSGMAGGDAMAMLCSEARKVVEKTQCNVHAH